MCAGPLPLSPSPPPSPAPSSQGSTTVASHSLYPLSFPSSPLASPIPPSLLVRNLHFTPHPFHKTFRTSFYMAFSKLFVAAVAVLSVATSITAAPVKEWNTAKFEAYDVYHTRYNALDCKHKHDTPFFTQCCGPLAVGKTLASRPAECTPASAVAASNSTVAATTGGKLTSDLEDDDAECDDGTADQVVDDDEECPEGTVEVGDDETDVPADDGSATTTLNPVVSSTSTTKSHSATKTRTTSASPTSSGTSSGSHSGKATFYLQGGAAGACGDKHPDSSFIGAMNYHLYGDADKKSDICGKKVKITNTANGKSVTITIADDCPSCNGEGDIDMSRAAFNAIGSESTGVLPIRWDYL